MEKHRKTVLIIDDNEALVEAMEVLLSDEHDVVSVTDAFQAIKVMNRIVPSLIFLDCYMPGYNGVQLLREIRQMKLSSRVVIITAAGSDQELLEEIRDLGVDGFLSKPFDVLDIREVAAAA